MTRQEKTNKQTQQNQDMKEKRQNKQYAEPGSMTKPKQPKGYCYCQQMLTNASLVTPPTPSKSNSSIIARNSSSSRPVSPNSLATRRRSSRSMYPFWPSSKSSNARRISSRGSRSRIFSAVTVWKAERGMRRFEGCCGLDAGAVLEGCCCCWCCEEDCCWDCCWTCGRGTP